MFEGYITAKFANKYFEKDVFKIIKRHTFWGTLLMMIPDFGFGGVIFAFVLWHMYSSICEKVGISFSDNFWKLAGTGFIINIIVALILDVLFSFFFFLVPFITPFQFYLSGKFFVETLKHFDSYKGTAQQTSTTNNLDNASTSSLPTTQEMASSSKPAEGSNDNTTKIVLLSIAGIVVLGLIIGLAVSNKSCKGSSNSDKYWEYQEPAGYVEDNSDFDNSSYSSESEVSESNDNLFQDYDYNDNYESSENDYIDEFDD